MKPFYIVAPQFAIVNSGRATTQTVLPFGDIFQFLDVPYECEEELNIRESSGLSALSHVEAVCRGWKSCLFPASKVCTVLGQQQSFSLFG